MKLDQKYFVPFLAIVAIITAVLITFFTISSQKGQRQAFREYIISQDSLKREKMPVLSSTDSLSVRSFSGKYVILDFWATWSNFSEDIHLQLAGLARQYPDSLEVIAALVQDKQEEADRYIKRHNFPFHFVDGTTVFNKYNVPGMPTELLYDRRGTLVEVFFGHTNFTKFDRLRTLMNHGK